MNSAGLRVDRTAISLSRLTSVLMIVSAAISIYWAAGGTELLDTIGGSIERWGRDGGVSMRLALTAIVVLKLVAAWLPLAAVRAPRRPGIRRLAWVQAAILLVYGGVLTGAGLAVQAHVVQAGPGADWKALDWHVYLWDPWFLLAGLLLALALGRTRQRRTAEAPHQGPLRYLC